MHSHWRLRAAITAQGHVLDAFSVLRTILPQGLVGIQFNSSSTYKLNQQKKQYIIYGTKRFALKDVRKKMHHAEHVSSADCIL